MLKDWKPNDEIVTETLSFAISTKGLEDRKEQDHSEEVNDEEMMSTRGSHNFGEKKKKPVQRDDLRTASFREADCCLESSGRADCGRSDYKWSNIYAAGLLANIVLNARRISYDVKLPTIPSTNTNRCDTQI